jgi:hypothetical protein
LKFLKRFNEELDPKTYRRAADKIEAGEGRERVRSRGDRAFDLRKHANIMESKTLLYYAFDWDDNILNMTTVIHMEHLIDGEWIPEDVSTSKFAEVRGDKENWRILGGNPELAFSEFRDNGPRGVDAFLEDVKESISNGRFAPAWPKFIKCLTNGAIFAIITARGHEPKGMRKGIEYIIDNILVDPNHSGLKKIKKSKSSNFTLADEMYNNLLKFASLFKNGKKYDRILMGVPSENELVKDYLDLCEPNLVGVSAPSRGGSPDNPEKAKQEALLEFQYKIDDFAAQRGLKAKIGFSDDDLKNVKHIEDLYANLSKERFPNIVEFTVKGTKNPENITKTVRTMESKMNETSQQTPGTENSVLKFTQFGNMAAQLNPQGPDQRQDDFANQFKRQTKYLSKTSKDILGNKKRKKKD